MENHSYLNFLVGGPPNSASSGKANSKSRENNESCYKFSLSSPYSLTLKGFSKYSSIMKNTVPKYTLINFMKISLLFSGPTISLSFAYLKFKNFRPSSSSSFSHTSSENFSAISNNLWLGRIGALTSMYFSQHKKVRNMNYSVNYFGTFWVINFKNFLNFSSYTRSHRNCSNSYADRNLFVTFECLVISIFRPKAALRLMQKSSGFTFFKVYSNNFLNHESKTYSCSSMKFSSKLIYKLFSLCLRDLGLTTFFWVTELLLV